MPHRAAETIDLEEAEHLLEETQAWIDAILGRLAPHLPRSQPLDVLDVGAAQGRSIIALQRHGHRAVGVEPWPEARVTAIELGERHGMEIEIRDGSAENLPFEDGTFDLVLATSVLEHVTDLQRTLGEIHRVLRPGGIFWFNSASSMSPRQSEIAGFPLFGWYPLPLKRRIMWWAVDHRPQLIGYTRVPAIHWFTPWSARRALRRAGFTVVWDRWDLVQQSELVGARGVLAGVGRRIRAVRYVGDVLIAGCSYAGRKAD
jgi:SAM-dependent methyltransferase